MIPVIVIVGKPEKVPRFVYINVRIHFVPAVNNVRVGVKISETRPHKEPERRIYNVRRFGVGYALARHLDYIGVAVSYYLVHLHGVHQRADERDLGLFDDLLYGARDLEIAGVLDEDAREGIEIGGVI